MLEDFHSAYPPHPRARSISTTEPYPPVRQSGSQGRTAHTPATRSVGTDPVFPAVCLDNPSPKHSATNAQLKTVCLVGFNLPTMAHSAETAKLCIIKQAWLNLACPSLCQLVTNGRDLIRPDVLWVHWGKDTVNLNGKSQRSIRDKLKIVLRRHAQAGGGDIIMEAEAPHWPGIENKHSQAISVFACSLHKGCCQHFVALTTLNRKPAPCQCGMLGATPPRTKEDQQQCYTALCQYLHGINHDDLRTSGANEDGVHNEAPAVKVVSICCNATNKDGVHESAAQNTVVAARRDANMHSSDRDLGSNWQPPRHGSTQTASGSSRVTFGTAEHIAYEECSATNVSEAFPTEQAIRQKQARDQRKQSMLDAGCSPEEIKRNLVKKKVVQQEMHYDDCGSDVEPIADEHHIRAMMASYSGTLEDALDFCFCSDDVVVEPVMTFPTVSENEDKPKRGRPRKYPLGAEFGCTACKRNLPAIDSKHTRETEPPRACKYPDIEPVVVSCPGCVANRSYDHPSHTGDESSCRMPSRRSYGKRRTSGPHRDPAVPAAGSSTDRNPQSTIMDFDHDPAGGTVSPIQPSVLVPSAPNVASDGDPEGQQRQPPNAASAREEDGGSEVQEEGADESAPASARATRIELQQRERAARQVEVGNQSDHTAVEDWRAFDVSRALAALRSSDPATRRKALQRLHIRLWHAPTEQFRRTLEAAGAPPQALAEVPSVVQGCLI